LNAVLENASDSSTGPVRQSPTAGGSLEMPQTRLRTKSGLVLPPVWVDYSGHEKTSGRTLEVGNCFAVDEILPKQAVGESPFPCSDCDSFFQTSTSENNLSLQGVKCVVPPSRNHGPFSWHEWETKFSDFGESIDSDSRVRYPLRQNILPTTERWRPRPPKLMVGRPGDEAKVYPLSRSPSGDSPFTRERHIDSKMRTRIRSPLPTRPRPPKLATSARSGRERRAGGRNTVHAERLLRPKKLEIIADVAAHSARSTRVMRRPHSTVVTAGMASGLEINVWDWDLVDTSANGSLVPNQSGDGNYLLEPRRESRYSAPSGLPHVPEEGFPVGNRKLCTEGDEPPVFKATEVRA